MALEEALFHSLIELPCLLLARLLQRLLRLPQRQAEQIAVFIFLAITLGACLLAWHVFESG
jgi:hypothetical protein